jgi:hypothetical protein
VSPWAIYNRDHTKEEIGDIFEEIRLSGEGDEALIMTFSWILHLVCQDRNIEETLLFIEESISSGSKSNGGAAHERSFGEVRQQGITSKAEKDRLAYIYNVLILEIIFSRARVFGG